MSLPHSAVGWSAVPWDGLQCRGMVCSAVGWSAVPWVGLQCRGMVCSAVGWSAVPWVGLQYEIMAFPGQTHILID